MHELEGIRISDVGYEKVCLNCIFWQTNVQLRGPAQCVICTKCMEHTNPDDSCSMFSPNMSVDNQDLNKYFDKKSKVQAWKRF